MPEPARCEICEQPLGSGAIDAVCLSCIVAGSAWAHRHITRLWNRGLDRAEIATELGYTPGSVTTIVRRLRAQGRILERRLPLELIEAARVPAPAAVTTIEEGPR